MSKFRLRITKKIKLFFEIVILDVGGAENQESMIKRRPQKNSAGIHISLISLIVR